MRDQYYEHLDQIVDDLVIIIDQVRSAVALSTEALLNADAAKAEQVIESETKIEESIDEVERALILLATQQPVATDLRQLVSTLRMVADLQRMSHLAVHVSKIARRRMPYAAVPAPVQPLVRDMAKVADSMIGSASRIVSNRDLGAQTGAHKAASAPSTAARHPPPRCRSHKPRWWATPCPAAGWPGR